MLFRRLSCLQVSKFFQSGTKCVIRGTDAAVAVTLLGHSVLKCLSVFGFFPFIHPSIHLACWWFFPLCHNLSCLNYCAQLILKFFNIARWDTRLCHYFVQTCRSLIFSLSLNQFVFHFYWVCIANLHHWHSYESNNPIFNWTV